MPNVGLKEKSKRTTARSPLENNAANARPEDSDVEMGDETSSDEEDVPEKDEAEKNLERMLFGDDEGFMGALKKQQDREAGMALTLNSDESDAEEDSEGEGEDLAGMADSDVCNPSPFLILRFDLTQSSRIALFPRLRCSCYHRLTPFTGKPFRCRG